MRRGWCALGDLSYATAWRIADRNAIASAAERETMGVAAAGPACVGDRSTAGQSGCPAERDCQLAGVSRSSVRRIEGNGRRRPGGQAKGAARRMADSRQCS